MDTFDGIFNGIICAEPYESKFLLKIKYNDFWFKFQLNGYGAENGVLLMSVNEVPVMFLDNSLLSMDVEFDAYFELIQVCKTKTGFELVLHFPQVRGYFGIQLSNKLELIKFVNIEAFADSKLNSKTDFKNFNQQLAKWKLLGGIYV